MQPLVTALGPVVFLVPPQASCLHLAPLSIF